MFLFAAPSNQDIFGALFIVTVIAFTLTFAITRGIPAAWTKIRGEPSSDVEDEWPWGPTRHGGRGESPPGSSGPEEKVS
jgi:hypothetical protein